MQIFIKPHFIVYIREENSVTERNPLVFFRTSLVAQTVKCLSAMWETWFQSLGQEDPLEKEMATHSSVLA